MAADRSASRRSVTPDIAECTTTGRKFAAMRSRSTPAILRQLATDETLVPPNFRTTQFSLFSNTDVNAHGGIADGGRSSRRQNSLTRLRRYRAALFPVAARQARPRHGSRQPCHVCRRQQLWGGVPRALSADRSHAILRPRQETHHRCRNVRLRVRSFFEKSP